MNQYWKRSNIRWSFLCIYASSIINLISCGSASNGVRGPDNSSAASPDKQCICEAYQLVTGRPRDSPDAEYIARSAAHRAHCNRVHIINNNLIIVEHEDRKNAFDLSSEEFDCVFISMFINVRFYSRLLLVYCELPFATIVRTLAAAACLPKWLFDSPEEDDGASIFRNNFLLILEQAKNFAGMENIKRAEDIPGVTAHLVRSILSIAFGGKIRYGPIDSCLTIDTKGDPRFVPRRNIFANDDMATACFHLIRLAGITELNIRGAHQDKPLTAEVRKAIGMCGITTLTAPLDIKTCNNLYLTKDTPEKLQNETWPKLERINLVSKDDVAMGTELDKLIEAEQTEFFRGLIRPELKPEDLSLFRLLEIPDGPRDKYLPWLEHATNLELIHFLPTSTEFGSIPQCIGNMKRLRVLQGVSAGITDIPDGILTRLSSLEKIILPKNRLTKLPDELGEQKKLCLLILNKNRLTHLPSTIVKCTSLKKLFVAGNCLKALPDGFEKLPALSWLNIAHNNNSALISTVMRKASWRNLSIGGNQITKLPDELWECKNLQLLGLDKCGLTEIPAKVFDIHSLNDLYLTGNELSAIPASIEKLRNLHSLHLENNKLQRLPRTLESMRRNNPNFMVVASKNPLIYSDTREELGLKSLRKLFNNFLMPDEEYVSRTIEAEKEQVYDKLPRKPQYRKMLWNLEAIRKLIAPVPAPHEIKTMGGMQQLWDKILQLCPYDSEEDKTIQLAHMNELITVIYDTEKAEIRGYVIGDDCKEPMKDYLEAVLVDMLYKLDGAEVRERECAVEMVRQLGDSLEFCPSRQLAELMSLYSLYCGSVDYRNVFAKYVENFIARMKENAFNQAATNPEVLHNVHLLLFWKRHLKEELGLKLDHEDPYAEMEFGIFAEDLIPVLETFFEVFCPESVISLLTQEINEEGKVGEAFKYLDGKKLLSKGMKIACFELAEDVQDALENCCFSRIRERGVRKMLLVMGILEERR